MSRPLALACMVALASACSSAEEEAPPAAPPRPRDPARPAAAACSLDPIVEHEGAAPALAPGAMILRGKEGAHRIVRLGVEGGAIGSAIALDAELVPAGGLARRGQGWVALARTARGTELFVIDGEVRAVRVGEQRLVDGAVAVRGDRAFVAWSDDAGILRASSVDCLMDSVSAAHVVGEPAPRALVLAAPTALGAAIARGAPGPIVLMTATERDERRAPGHPLGLLPRGDGILVLHASPRATGLWLGAPGAEATRVTDPSARPETPAIAPLPRDSALLVYRSGADLFLQRVDEQGAPDGDPRVIDSALGDAPRARPLVATNAQRFWIAYETVDEEGPHVRVRTGACD